MDHERIQAEISARLDGEAPSIADDVLEAHLAGCEECRAFYQEARSLGDMLGATPDAAHQRPPEGADLTASILASVEGEWRRARMSRLASAALSRIALGLLALVYACWGVWLLAHSTELLHAGAESGALAPNAQPELANLLVQGAAMRLALALALVFAAWRPRLALGLLPFVASYTMFSLGFAMRDVALGAATLTQLTGLSVLMATVLVSEWAVLAAYGTGGLRSVWGRLGAGPQGG